MSHPLPSGQAEAQANYRNRLTAAATLLLSLLYTLLFGWLALRRYWGYEMHALDMGNMGQAAWNTIHGHPFSFTDMRLPYAIEAWNTTTRLSFHVEALFPIISLVYLVYPHPESLIVLQTLAIAAGAWAVYAIAQETVRRPWLSLTLAACYLLAPSVESMNLYEFHPVALATPLLLYTWLYMLRRQWIPFALCCLAAMGTKEELGLTVALFALYAAFRYGQRGLGIGLAVFGVAWSLIAALLIERHFRRPGTVTYTHTRYAYLGHGLHGALHTVLHDPLVFFRVIGTEPKAAYIAHLLGPYGMLSVFAAPFLALSTPTLALNLLATDIHMNSGLGHNSAEIISAVTIAAIIGAGVAVALLGRALSPRIAEISVCAILLVSAVWCQRIDGFTPIGSRFQVVPVGRHQQISDRFVAMVPGTAPVSTQDQLDPHLSSRRYLYLFEDTGRIPPLVPANYVLLDASAPTYPLPSYQIHDRAMSLLKSTGWGVEAAEDGLILLHRGTASKRIPAAFYTYMDGRHFIPTHRMSFKSRGIEISGYSVAQSDLPNYRIPRLLYTFFARRTGARRSLRPVVYEVVGDQVAGCAASPLGLAWQPTSTWTSDRPYLMRSDYLDTEWQSPAQAHLYLEIRPVVHDPQPDCTMLWRTHGRLADLGTRSISF